MLKRLQAIVLFLLFSSFLWAEETTPASTVEELETRITDILEANNTPGMIAAIVSGNNVVWQGAIGIANRDTGQAVTRETMFRVGSISKSFVSLSILKLKYRGDLSLDLVINEIVPEAGVVNPWEQDNPVRLYHVLEHTAGFDDINIRDYVHSDPDATLLGGIQFNNGSKNVRWVPGTHMSYSNIGPPIAALVLEKITGERYEDFVDREIFAVLGMETATFFFDEGVAASYAADGETREPYVYIHVRPSGALNVTGADMIQLLKMYNGRGELDGQTLIQKDSLDRMETATSTLAATHGLNTGYGLSNATSQKDGFVYHGHGGGIDGFLSNYAYLPDHGLGYFFSINAGNGKTAELIDAEIRRFMTRDIKPPAPVPPIQIVDENLAWLVGYYEPDAPRMDITRVLTTLLGVMAVDYSDGSLTIGSPFGEKQELQPTSNEMFIKQGDALPSLIFVNTGQGEIHAQGRFGNLGKTSSTYIYARWVLVAFTVLMMVSSLFFAPVWIIRKLLGKLGSVNVWVRSLPLIATLIFVGLIILIMAGLDDMSRLAYPTFWSVAYWLLSMLFVGLSIGAFVYVASRYGLRREGGPAVWIHSMLVSVAVVLLSGYWGYYGLVGLKFWTY